MNNIRHFTTQSEFGESGYGHTVTLYGDTTGKYVKWNSTADQFEIEANTTITGDVSISGALSVSGAISHSTNLAVGGKLTVSGGVVAAGTTASKGVTWTSTDDVLKIAGNSTITGNIEQTGNQTLTGDATINGSLSVIGDTTSKGVLWVSSSDTLHVTADTTITGNIDQAGNHTMTGNQTITGNLSVTGDFLLVDAPLSVVGGTSTPDVADLPNNTYQSIASTSDCIKKYLLATPVNGAVKRILCTKAQSTSPVYVYASASSAYTAYFGANTSGNILILESNCLPFTLVGVSTAQWLITNVSTYNTTGDVTIASSNT